MIRLSNDTKVFFRLGSTDMRKSFSTLAALVEHQMKLNAFSNSMFVFCGKTKRTLKILYWDTNGFCIWMKRLESDKFKWPKSEGDVLEITAEQLDWFLRGLDFTKAYKKIGYTHAS